VASAASPRSEAALRQVMFLALSLRSRDLLRIALAAVHADEGEGLILVTLHERRT
jgi:hypothetical protein